MFIALLIIVRFLLELLGTPLSLTRYISSSGAVFLVALYLGAVAPLRGVRRSYNLVLPGIVLAVWTQGWVILLTLIPGPFSCNGATLPSPRTGETGGTWDITFPNTRWKFSHRG